MSQNNPEKTLYRVHHSVEELGSIHDEVVAKYPEHVILYRGQTKLYPSLQSGRRRPGVEVNADVEQGWSVVAGQIIAEDGEPQNILNLRKAVLQHFTQLKEFSSI